MERRPATVADALAEFLDDLLLSNRSPRTIRTYRVLLRFPDMPLLDFDRAFCRAWLMTQLRQRKPSGAKTCKGALSSFCSWLVGRGWLAVNPCDGLGRVRVPQSPPRALSEAQMAKLWRAAEELDSEAASPPNMEEGGAAGPVSTLAGRYGQATLARTPDSITNRLLEESNPAAPPVRRDGTLTKLHRPSYPALWRAAEELDGEIGAMDEPVAIAHSIRLDRKPHGAPLPPHRESDGNPLPASRRDSITNRLLLSLLSAGLRRSEVAGLRWQDMDFERRTMRVLGKGSKVRTVLIPRAAMELICAGRASEMQSSSSLTVIDRPASPAPAQPQRSTGSRVAMELIHGSAEMSRGENPINSPINSGGELIGRYMRGSVFGGNVQQNVQATANLSRGGNVQRFGSVFGVSDERIYQKFKLIARRAGVACTPHQLRHTFATNYLRKGGSPLYLQQLGGWSGSEMVALYSRAALADAAIEEARRLEE